MCTMVYSVSVCSMLSILASLYLSSLSFLFSLSLWHVILKEWVGLYFYFIIYSVRTRTKQFTDITVALLNLCRFRKNIFHYCWTCERCELSILVIRISTTPTPANTHTQNTYTTLKGDGWGWGVPGTDNFDYCLRFISENLQTSKK